MCVGTRFLGDFGRAYVQENLCPLYNVFVIVEYEVSLFIYFCLIVKMS